MGESSSKPITQMSSDEANTYVKKLQNESTKVSNKLKQTQDMLKESSSSPDREAYMDFVECWNMNSLQKLWHSKRCKNAMRQVGAEVYDNLTKAKGEESINQANSLTTELDTQISHLQEAKTKTQENSTHS